MSGVAETADEDRGSERGGKRRASYLILLLLLAGSGLAVFASTQTWFSVDLRDLAEHPSAVAVPGSAAAPALTALSLAGFALVAALAIAGPVFRVIFGVLGVLLGLSVSISAGSALSGAVQASAASITAATGVAGSTSVAQLVERIDTELWPWAAVVAGLLIVLGSVAVLVTGRHWHAGSPRYRVRFEQQSVGNDSAARRSSADGDWAVASWDELSRGEDPTR